MSGSDAKLCFALTDAGKMILRGIVFIALAAFIVPAFGVLSALVSVMLTALIVGFVLRPRIMLSGNLPDRIVVNHTVQLRYVVRNIGHFAAYNLSLRFDTLPDAIEQIESGQIISRLGSAESAELTITIRPGRRGYYRINQPVCRSSCPFNLFSFGASRNDPERLVVLPAFSLLRVLLRHLNPQIRSESTILAGRTGAFPEYAGNRPFVPGDSRRRIDARAWARLSVPATKEYHENFDNCTALVLDTGVSEAVSALKTRQSKEFEAAVSLCASVAFTINDNCLIDLLVAGPNLHQFSNMPRSTRLDKIHEILAGVEPSGNYTLERMMPILAEHLGRVSEVVFILSGCKNEHQRLLELAVREGCHSTVFIIGESGQDGLDRYETERTETVQILSPDEILSEQVIRL
jgi:uncharacterized protein (DUF58 family)